MKIMYKQPIVEKTEMMPRNIICASIGEGDPLNPGDPPAYTD